MSSTEHSITTQRAGATESRSQVSRHLLYWLFFCSALVIGGGFAGHPSNGWAEVASSYRGVPLQEGIMTGKGATSVQINRVEYRVHPKIVVKVAPGEAWSLDALPSGATVRFHVQEGQIDFLMYVPNN